MNYFTTLRPLGLERRPERTEKVWPFVRVRRGRAAVLLTALYLRLGGFSHVEVLFEGRQGLGGEGLQVGVRAPLGFALELVYVGAVVGDHVAHIGFIELRSAQLGQAVVGGLILGVDRSRKGDAVAGRDLFQFIVGLGVVVDHLLTEVLDGLAGGLFFGQFAEFDFGHSALRGFI